MTLKLVPSASELPYRAKNDTATLMARQKCAGLSPLPAASVCGNEGAIACLFDRILVGRLGLAQLDPVAMKGHRSSSGIRLSLVGSGLVPRVWRIIT